MPVLETIIIGTLGTLMFGQIPLLFGWMIAELRRDNIDYIRYNDEYENVD